MQPNPEAKFCISRGRIACRTCSHCCLEWSEDSASSPNRTMSSAYSKSKSEFPGRSSTPRNLDEKSVGQKFVFVILTLAVKMNTPEPTIQNILDSSTLRWIFVGGKGGVGKTTCSCSIAVQMAKVRERVLILSTDPAHNLSDAFDQKFSKNPTKVKGFNNLFAMEIDPNVNLGEFEEDLVGSEEAAVSADIRKTIGHLMTSFPGVDEYMSYTEVFRLVRNMDYSVVIFDTAPTGHTLRLLAFPEAMEKSLSKVVSMKNQFAPILNQLMGLVGMNSTQGGDLTNAIETRLPIVKEITKQFKDSTQTTFVCVCIPEFLSMYETERLVQVSY
ncbi:unnamed protein product [Schistosoma margrebowiei]|uniref:ArsA/GET3 Anion-transporting ATPase-like domain-containing protein n=1 Tax=Schistosoma margrebowiei TaxID=48269 RepID=A0A183N6L4_9TREM|nr:unnamed protein product [Schistosoma margrebowiei]